jgi:hypothetical protein
MRLNLRVRGVTIPPPPGMGLQRFSPALRKTDLAASILRHRKMPIRPLPPPVKNSSSHRLANGFEPALRAIVQRALVEAIGGADAK